MEFKGKSELHKLLLLYDNLMSEIESGRQELDKATAQKLYKIYDAIEVVLSDNLSNLKNREQNIKTKILRLLKKESRE